MHIKTHFLNFAVRITTNNFAIQDNTIPLNTTFINKLRSQHAAILVSKFSLADNCSFQLLADERCRWLTDDRSRSLRLMKKKRKKKKLQQSNLHKSKTLHINSISSLKNLHLNYNLTTHPVISSKHSNVYTLSERCNDCNVIKIFKKRRKESSFDTMTFLL